MPRPKDRKRTEPPMPNSSPAHRRDSSLHPSAAPSGCSRQPAAPHRSPASLRSWLAVALTAACLAMALVATSPAEASAYQKGEPVQFTGLVTDGDGTPIGDVQVVLEASRNKFSYLKLRRERVDDFRVSSTTNSSGEYRIRWPWNEYYNGFELLVTIPVRRKDGEHLRVLLRKDISELALTGSPVVTPLVIEDTSFLVTFRRFLAALDSDDEKRVYQEQGRPDKVEEPRAGEGAWWYFDRGKVYRFENGRLTKVDSFDPIQPIDG